MAGPKSKKNPRTGVKVGHYKDEEDVGDWGEGNNRETGERRIAVSLGGETATCQGIREG
jgi:hypothetical protein